MNTNSTLTGKLFFPMQNVVLCFCFTDENCNVPCKNRAACYMLGIYWCICTSFYAFQHFTLICIQRGAKKIHVQRQSTGMSRWQSDGEVLKNQRSASIWVSMCSKYWSVVNQVTFNLTGGSTCHGCGFYVATTEAKETLIVSRWFPSVFSYRVLEGLDRAMWLKPCNACVVALHKHWVTFPYFLCL